MGEALSQTVQSLLPAALLSHSINDSSSSSSSSASDKQPASTDRRLNERGWALVQCVGVLGLALGVADALVAGGLPVALPHLFTRSSAVARQMAVGAPLLALCLTLHALSNMLEGILFATKDLSFFSRIYPASSVAAFLLFSRQRASAGGGILTLPEVWRTFLVYQVIRCLQCAARVAFNQRIRPAGESDAGSHLDGDASRNDSTLAERVDASSFGAHVPQVGTPVHLPPPGKQLAGGTGTFISSFGFEI